MSCSNPRAARGLPARAVPLVLVASLALLTGCTADAPAAGSATSAPASPGASGAAPAVGAPPVASPGSFDRIPAVIRSTEPSVVTIFTSTGLGSGVVYRADGTIVTNEHVVHGTRTVQVAFADGKRVAGRVLAADAATDLAVVRAERGGLPPAPFRTALPQVGDLAVALGSPLGFEGTATAGIISGLSREIPGSARSSTALVDLIQTDAPISPGNSGGALVDAEGRVIGINDAYIPPSAGAVSLGFAIPGATVVDVVEQLLRTGEVRSAFVGIRSGRITPQVAQQLGLSGVEGVLVLDVVKGSPAAQAGLRPGDVVTAFDGKPVRSVEDFLGALRTVRPGQQVPVERLRDGSTQTVQLTLGEVTRSAAVPTAAAPEDGQ